MKRYLRALIQAGAELYEVGGPVRDHLLERPTKDHDYLVRLIPVERLCEILKPYGQVTLAGRHFGVIKFTPYQDRGGTVDLALPRTERSTGSGHRDFDVAFDPLLPVEEDLGRRDFTINAMARNLASGDIIDPFGGRADLDAGVLRQVFPAAFKEDPLRILRGVQFAARFKLAIEPGTWAAMKRHGKLLGTVSPERIAEEIKKLLGARKPSQGFILMRDAGLLSQVLPELDRLTGIEQDKMPGDDVFLHTMRALDAARGDKAIDRAGDLNLMLAVLLHDVGKARTARYHEASKRVVFFGHQIVSRRIARRWLKRMKMSAVGADIDEISTLIENHMFETKAFFTDRAIRRFIAKVGPELIYKLLDLRIADNRGGKHPQGIRGVQKLKRRITEELERKPPFGPRDLAISGNDVMDLGVPEGPAVGAVLARLVDLVLDAPELNTREQLLALVRNMSEDTEFEPGSRLARKHHGRQTTSQGRGKTDSRR